MSGFNPGGDVVPVTPEERKAGEVVTTLSSDEDRAKLRGVAGWIQKRVSFEAPQQVAHPMRTSFDETMSGIQSMQPWQLGLLIGLVVVGASGMALGPYFRAGARIAARDAAFKTGNVVKVSQLGRQAASPEAVKAMAGLVKEWDVINQRQLARHQAWQKADRRG